jgi:hypothetical protein
MVFALVEHGNGKASHAEPRGSRSVDLTQDSLEKRGEVDFQGRQSRSRLPGQHVVKYLGSEFIGAPALEKPSVEVDDPVLRNAVAQVGGPLGVPICARRGR